MTSYPYSKYCIVISVTFLFSGTLWHSSKCCSIISVAWLCTSSTCFPCPYSLEYLEQEISRSLYPPLKGPLPTATPIPSAPQPRELLSIEEESERLARELKEVRRGNRNRLRNHEYHVFQKGDHDKHVVQVVILTQFAFRCQGTGTVYVTSWSSSASTEGSWSRAFYYQPHR